MKNRKLCGYDLNGIRDFAARNWRIRPGEGTEFDTSVMFGGQILPSLVLAGADASARWIGGVQAELAPHGRGDGWGEVGKTARRMSVRQSLSLEPRGATGYLTSALRGLATGAEHAVVAIPDVPETTDAYRESLLAALSAARIKTSLLVWRPVLACLFAIERKMIHEGQSVGVISHSAGGFSVQKLGVRRESGSTAPVLAPERRQFGGTTTSHFGYDGLLALAREVIVDLSDSRSAYREAALSIGRLAMGQPNEAEILRKPNGDWEELNLPADLRLPPSDLNASGFEQLADCSVLLFETLAEGDVRGAIIRALAAVLEREPLVLPATSVAEGALVAAARLGPRDPIYFDFLPQISTIVQGSEGAMNFDLIDEGATLPAGRFYRSATPARFGIQPGQESFSVYLRKQLEQHPRKAVVPLGGTLDQTTPVDLWVEQMPAAGRAKILMQAPTLSRQFSVDWDTATEVHQQWEEIIADLATPLPTIPRRLILPCGMQAWQDSNRAPGLLSLLDLNADRARVDWDDLAAKLSQRPFGEYCISSDGKLPPDVPQDAIDKLARLTERAVVQVLERAMGRRTDTNDSLKFLTWQFRRCPPNISELLFDAWRAGDGHPFLTHPSHRMLVYQGLGRVAGSEESERRAVDLLFDRPTTAWVWREETACMAFLLSRSDSAPLLLDREQVNLLAERVVHEFEENLGTEYTKFAYAPFLLVGLLRWRLKEPRALVVGLDPQATAMAEAVRAVLPDMRRKVRRLPRLSKYIKILDDVHDELEGVGTNPNLLLDIYG